MIGSLLDELTFTAGAILIAFSLIAFRRTRRFIARCRTAEGRIAGYTTEEDSEDGVWYFSRIRFTDAAGVEREIPGSRGQRQPPVVGETMPITYDPAYPTNAWITGTAAPWVLPWIVLIAGLAAVAGGFVLRVEMG